MYVCMGCFSALQKERLEGSAKYLKHFCKLTGVSLGEGYPPTRGRTKACTAGARHVTVGGGRVSIKDFLALGEGSPVEMGREN